MINLNPDVWEIKLTGNQVIPAHVFGARTVQMFTSGSVPIDGEGSCGTGDVRWAEGGVHSGAGLSLVSGWTFVMRLEFDPGCIAAAHSHPGNIIYIVVEGEMTIPGEGVYSAGDMRWALKDCDYNQEEMGPTGTTLIGIQQGSFEADRTE